MYTVDLNCDLGESFGAYTIGNDFEVIPFITSANIACGFHASDPVVMEKTVQAAVKNGVSLGAHPGFPDLMGFGRRNMKITPEEAEDYVMYQIGALQAFATSCGKKLHHVKPHGALYNMAAKDSELSKAICRAVYSVDKSLYLLALSGSYMVQEAEKMGLRVACEVFADRAYQSDGTLVPRSQEGSVITDEDVAVDRVIRMVKEKKVRAIDGTDIDVQADSVCVHGDNQKALDFVKKIQSALEKEHIKVCSFEKEV